MPKQTQPSMELVPVIAVRTVWRADVIRAALKGAGVDSFVPGRHTNNILPHMSLAVNPRGIEVLVRRCDLPTALKALRVSLPPVETAREAASPPTADDYAGRAAICAMFALIVTPLALCTLYFIVRALAMAKTRPPENKSAFRRNLIAAAVVGVGLAALVAWYGIGFVADLAREW